MAQRRTLISEGLFWGLMAAVMAGTMAGAMGFVFAQFYGAGWVGGAALGAVVFLVAAIILAKTANSTNLPPPNVLSAPVAPPGGKFQAPPGGRFQAPASATSPRSAAGAAPVAAKTPAEKPAAPAEPKPSSIADMADSVADATSKAAYTASAAVTSAAEAARAAIADILGGSEPAATAPGKPAGLAAPREGGPDDLKVIKGIGPKLEELLHSLGYYHFDQIANWTQAEIDWVDSNLEGLNGRATRDDWVGQAKALVAAKG